MGIIDGEEGGSEDYTRRPFTGIVLELPRDAIKAAVTHESLHLTRSGSKN